MAVEKKPVKIMETVLRDAHQSLIATRMTTEHKNIQSCLMIISH